MTESQSEAAIDAGYRSLLCAIILEAVKDSADPQKAQEAMGFLKSAECKMLLRLAGIRWTATSADIGEAAVMLQGRRARHLAGSARSPMPAV